MTMHLFGGDWTEDKLNRVRKYLKAYTTIFEGNPKARYYTTIYVDAFAGTGYRSDPHKRHDQDEMLFPELTETEAQGFLNGSARNALEVEPPFQSYIFVERSPIRVQELEKLKDEFPSKAKRLQVINQDAGVFLKEWCGQTNWNKCRAVVFLDPYGMQVDWSLIETIAKTKAIDLWILFPLASAVNRLLTRNEPPPKQWAQALTRIFGTEDWQDYFYPHQTVPTLFGNEERQEKSADFDAIGRYFVNRLKTVFAKVAENPLPLRNSKNVPLYLLCFAAGNPVGAATGVKIAQDILGR